MKYSCEICNCPTDEADLVDTSVGYVCMDCLDIEEED